MNSNDGMLLKISLGNSKLGNIPNLSLPPIISCRQGVPCHSDCYAQKFYRMWPSVKAAWDSNLRLYDEDPDRFFSDLIVWLTINKPPRFRLHVSGDFPDEMYFIRMCDVFEAQPQTQCLVFTKCYDYPLRVAPPNMKVVLSLWPGLDTPEAAEEFPCAYLSHDHRVAELETVIKCKSGCVECGYACFNGLSPELPVVFDMH